MKASSVAALLLLWTATASAGNYTKVVTHLSARPPEHIVSVLTSYSQTCHAGCKYEAPNVKQLIQLDYEKTAKSWYTWTWVSSTLKDTKYFNHVTRIDKPDGTILLVLELVGKDKPELRAKLEKVSGKSGDAAFDLAKTVFVIRRQDDGKTKFIQDVTLVASGLLDAFAGTINEGIATGTAANIKNIEK